MVLLLAVQPLLDVLSYFWSLTGHGNLLTLGLRLGVLGVAVLYGFYRSQHKGIYWSAAGVLVLYWVIHVIFCVQAGYQDPFSDLTNYIRVVQIVAYTLCFITFLRFGEPVYRAVITGLCLNLGICALVVFLSTLTGTDPHTYSQAGLGALGWFSTTNSQSAVLSVLVPIALMAMLLYRGKGQYLLLLGATGIGFALLYFIGTRLAYASLLATAVGLPIVLALSRHWDLRKAVILLLCGAVSLAMYHASPMYQKLSLYSSAMEAKQGWAETKMEWAEESMEESMLEALEGSSNGEVSTEESEAAKLRRLTPVYEWCASNIVDRFGVETVIRKYNFTSNVQEITAARQQKIYFCELLQDELPVTAKLFGMELGRMTYQGQVYDVENDFYGIYFLYGIVGLVLLLCFIGYFLVQILLALLRDPKKYFTPMAGAIGISLIIILVYAVCTAGVLRRPNASVYLSLLLALSYYLVKIKKYPEDKEAEAL
jgi:hypothetical protein